jgi:uncharacterized protein YjbI with pentapeptide repeats
MTGMFAGKIQYCTATEVEPRRWLTVVPGDDEPSLQLDFTDYRPLPVLLYRQPDDSFLAAMAVPADDAVAVGYLALPQPGALTIDPAVGNAVPLRLEPFGAVAGAWSVLPPQTWSALSPQTKTWHQVYYTQDWYGAQGKLWCDPTPWPETPITTLQCYGVTPGYATLASTKQGQKADLAYTDLSGLDFTGIDFTKADFSGAVLTGTIFHGATLTDAVFTGATADKMEVTGATLDGAVFAGVDLSRVVWGSDEISAKGAHFEGSNLAGCRFPAGANFTGAFFNGANVAGSVFEGAMLAGATFTGATIDGMDVTAATLDGVVFTGLNLGSVVWGSKIAAAGAHFEHCSLQGCHFGAPTATADFSGAYFNGAGLRGTDLTRANLTGATFYGANLTGAVLNFAILPQALLGGSSTEKPASLAYAVMSNVVLTGADLFGVNLVGVTLFGANTRIDSAATIEQADFTNAYLVGVSFENSNLRGANFNGACLVNAVFTGAQLGVSAGSSMSASFGGACLNGAGFTGAVLAGVNFANAAVSFESGSFPVRYCNERGMMPPNGTIPINCRATAGLDLTTLCPDTICPNGSTLQDNQASGTALEEMLSAPAAPTQWCVSSCFYHNS